jgi:hypothetical protein
MAPTWRNLSRHIDAPDLPPSQSTMTAYYHAPERFGALTLREADAEMDWRHLFDLLLQSAVTFTPEARGAMKRAEELLGEIGETAERLSELLREYSAVRERHQFTAPEPFSMLGEWISATTGEPEPGRYEPSPAAMIETLAFAAWNHTIDADEIDAAFIHDRKFSHVAAWVRHFDALWQRWQVCMAARFTVSNTDLARVASAVLRMNVSREAVKVARERARAEPQDEADNDAELFAPD